MSDELEQLERELASFKPAPVPRELKARIASAIEASGESHADSAAKPDVVARIGPETRGSQTAGLVAMAAAIAACVVVMVNVVSHPTSPEKSAGTIAANTPSVTSVASYRQALAESPEALERLLDRDATRVLASAAAARSDARNDAWR